jgi:hypothetical protein
VRRRVRGSEVGVGFRNASELVTRLVTCAMGTIHKDKLFGRVNRALHSIDCSDLASHPADPESPVCKKVQYTLGNILPHMVATQPASFLREIRGGRV